MLWFVNIEKITGRKVDLEIIFKGDYLADIEELLLSDRVPGRAYWAFITKGIDKEKIGIVWIFSVICVMIFPTYDGNDYGQARCKT